VEFKLMKKKIILLSLVLLTLTACAPATGSYASNVLSVTGQSQVSIAPDVAYVSIGVRTESTDVSQAVSNNASQAERVMSALRDAGVSQDDMQTTNFSVYSYDDYDFEGNSIGLTFNVENTVYVTVRNLAGMGELLDSAVGSGANNIWGIQFDVEDKSAAVAEARSLALADAQEQAQALASEAEVSLGAITSLSYTNGGYSAYPLYGVGGGGAGIADSSTTIVPGQISVNVSVYLSYEIR
jgi:hypothetical protein